jgi:hypothetical protein
MPTNIFASGPTPNTIRSADGEAPTPPNNRILLPPGDAALTRRVKAAGDHWVVQEKKGRKIFSRGVWAAATTIEKIRAEVEVERITASFVRRREADVRRRGFDEITAAQRTNMTVSIAARRASPPTC